MNIGIKIKELRKQKGITQTELSKVLGVGKTTISNYETGYSTPDSLIIQRLSEFFNVSTDFLIKNSEQVISCNSKYNKTKNVLDISDLDEDSVKELLHYKELLLLKQEVDKNKDEISICLTKNA